MAGRPKIEFKKEYIEQVKRLALLGLSNDRIANVLCISEKTFYNWQKEYPDFLQSIKDGKDVADANIAESLYNKAQQQTSNAIFSLSGDTTACIFWLKNRHPNLWADKPENKSDGNDTALTIAKAIKIIRGQNGVEPETISDIDETEIQED